jgi:hypothetical protein
MKKWTTTAWCSVFFLCGCAHVEVRHVPDGDVSDGVHFYEPRPYLLIADQTKPGTNEHAFTTSIVYLPDKARYYVVNVIPGWGTVNGSVKLADGWRLDTLGAQMDSKGPETISAVSGLVTAAAGMAVKTDKHPQAGLYRIDINTNGDVKLTRQAGWEEK